MNPVITYAKAHPVPVALGVVAVGLVLLYLMGSGKAAASDGGSGNAAAYFAAASAQAQAGDAVQIAQINAQSDVTKTLLNDQTAIANATTWSGAQTTQILDTNATSVDLAPFAVQGAAIEAINTAVQAPPVTTTTTKTHNSGLFGGLLFGGSGSSTTTTTAPNPVATSAINQLDQFLNGYAPGH